MLKKVSILLLLLTNLLYAASIEIETANTSTIKNEVKDWKIGMKNLQSEKQSVNIEIDLGLGDTVFPGVEREVIDKLNKAFDPIVEKLEEIKGKNIQRLNTNKIKKAGTKLTNGFMAFMGIDEGRIDKLLNYVRCTPDSQSEPNKAICIQTLDYSEQEEALLGGLQKKIKEAKKNIMEAYKNNISNRAQILIDQLKEKEKMINDFLPKTLDTTIQDSLRNILTKGCDVVKERITSGTNSLEGDVVGALCDAKINEDYTKYYNLISGVKGLESFSLEESFYYTGGLKSKKVDACKILEQLNSNNFEVRQEAKENLQKKAKEFQEKIKGEIINVVAEEVMRSIPKLLIKQQSLDIPYCIVVANVKLAKQNSGTNDSGGDASSVLDDITGIFSSLADAGSSMFGDGEGSVKKRMEKCYKEIKDAKDATGEKQSKEVGFALDETMAEIPLIGFTLGFFAGWIPDISIEWESNLAAIDEQTKLQNCIGATNDDKFNKIFQECMEGKQDFQLFNLDNPLLVQLQSLSNLLQIKKRQTCLFDQKDFNKTIPHKDGAVNVNINFLIDKLPNLVKPTPESDLPQGNLFVLKQKLIKKDIEFSSFVNDKSPMYDFYNKEYKNLLGEESENNLDLVDNYHKNALCFISYDEKEGKTQLGSESVNLHTFLGFDQELTTNECVQSPPECTIIKNTEYIWYDNGYSLGGYKQNCNFGTNNFTNIIYKDGIGMYCHKLAKDIENNLDILEDEFIKEKVCSNNVNISCTKDCGKDGECISKIYSSVLAKQNPQLKGFRQAINQFTHCVALTEKIKGAKITSGDAGGEKFQIGMQDNKRYLVENLFKEKMGLKSKKGILKDMVLYNEYREIFNEKLSLDKDEKYLKQICMNLTEPENPLELSPEYIFCKELKLTKQQEIKYELINNSWKNREQEAETELQKYELLLELEVQNEELEKLLED